MCNIYTNISNVNILRSSCIEGENVQKLYLTIFLTTFSVGTVIYAPLAWNLYMQCSHKYSKCFYWEKLKVVVSVKF